MISFDKLEVGDIVKVNIRGPLEGKRPEIHEDGRMDADTRVPAWKEGDLFTVKQTAPNCCILADAKGRTFEFIGAMADQLDTLEEAVATK